MKTQNIILKINQTQVCIKEIIELYISLSTAVRSDSPTHFPGKVLKILLANYTVNQAHKITDNCLLSIRFNRTTQVSQYNEKLRDELDMVAWYASLQSKGWI